MKILMLVRALATGTETYTRNLILALQERGATVVVGEVGKGTARYPCQSIPLCDSIPTAVDRLDVTQLFRFGLALKGMSALIDRFNPHILFAQGLDELASIASLASKLYGRPAISFVHDLTLNELRLDRRGRSVDLLYALSLVRQRYTAKTLAKILVASKFMRDSLNRMFQIDSAITEPGVAGSFFLESRRIGERQFNLLFLGSLTPKKTVQTAVRALRHLADLDVTLTIVGEGPMKDSLSKLAVDIGVGEKVSFLGYLSDSELLNQLRDSHVCLVPSQWEGFGLAPLECMAAGLPVIASSAGGLKEMVADGFNGYLVPVGNDLAIADRVRILYQDRDKWLWMSSNSRTAARRYTWDSTADKTISAITDVLRRN
ncbi:MAG: glycosyltransferase family 4 protein [Nitrososphaerales archaeon]|nr:glycosyltransferase family 4 protein [Nitrososphaerales archaeon]